MQVHSQILASDIPKTLRMPSHDLLSGCASQLYALVHVLSRGSSLVGVPLREWASLVRGLDSEVPAEQQLEALLLKALSLGARYEVGCVVNLAVVVSVVIQGVSHRSIHDMRTSIYVRA